MSETTAPNEQPSPSPSTPDSSSRATKANLLRTLPTDRVSFKKQDAVLRAYGAASGNDKAFVGYSQVADIAGIVASTVALVTPFLTDSGLLTRDGTKFRPNDAVFDYLHALEWNSETAGLKLGRTLSDSWAAKALLPRLRFSSMSKEDAIAVLAEESRATKAHRINLETLLEFLNLAGVVRLDGNSVYKGGAIAPPPLKQDEQTPTPTPTPVAAKPPMQSAEKDEPQQETERFVIPIPDKSSATITVPRDLDADDWVMVKTMLETYITRMQSRRAKN